MRLGRSARRCVTYRYDLTTTNRTQNELAGARARARKALARAQQLGARCAHPAYCFTHALKQLACKESRASMGAWHRVCLSLNERPFTSSMIYQRAPGDAQAPPVTWVKACVLYQWLVQADSSPTLDSAISCAPLQALWLIRGRSRSDASSGGRNPRMQ